MYSTSCVDILEEHRTLIYTIIKTSRLVPEVHRSVCTLQLSNTQHVSSYECLISLSDSNKLASYVEKRGTRCMNAPRRLVGSSLIYTQLGYTCVHVYVRVCVCMYRPVAIVNLFSLSPASKPFASHVNMLWSCLMPLQTTKLPNGPLLTSRKDRCPTEI